MKGLKFRILPYLIYCAVFQNVGAQSTLPSNTSWVYNGQKVLIGGNEIVLNKPVSFAVIKDTVILGQRCSEVTADELPFWYSSQLSSVYMYREGNEIFYYNPISQDFELWVRYDMEFGDTLELIQVGEGGTTVDLKFRVVGILDKVVSNRSYRHVYLSKEDDPNSEPIEIIDGIGWTSFFIPAFNVHGPHNFSHVRCFESDSNSLKFVNYDCQFEWTSTFGFEGTRWNYCVEKEDEKYEVEVVAQSSKMLDFGGLTCTQYQSFPAGNSILPDSFTMCARSNTWFILQDSALYPVLDFDLRTGQTALSHGFVLNNQSQWEILSKFYQVDARWNSYTNSNTLRHIIASWEDGSGKFQANDVMGDTSSFLSILPVVDTMRLRRFYSPFYSIEVENENCVISSTAELPYHLPKVIPNPTKGSFTIQVEGQRRVEEVRLFDIQGRRIPTSFRAYDQIVFGHWNPGTYILHILLEDGTHQHSKLVVSP